MIPFTNFAQNVKNGRITISKVNDAFALTKKQFNPDTGEEIDAEVVAIDPVELLEQKQKQLEIIAQIDAVLAEIKKIQ